MVPWELLAVDQLGYGRAAVADESGDCSIGMPLSDGRDMKLCRSSRSVHCCASSPAAAAPRRKFASA